MWKLTKSYPKSIQSIIQWLNGLMIITVASAIITIATILIKAYDFQNKITLPPITIILTIIAIISAVWSIKIELKKVYPNSNIHNIIIVYTLTFLIVSTTFLNLITMLIAPKLFKTSISLMNTESTILLISLSAIITIMSIFFGFNDIAEDVSLIPIIIGFIPYVIDAILVTGIIIFTTSPHSLLTVIITIPIIITLSLYLFLLVAQRIEHSINN